ncbi:phage antirepressor N-terminal domain-containing protein [Bacteroidales bacterium OttesenSCG-928-I21]|nr:phage antirepressor N-terminal domain-containing protein [Bacteroidales bacterium OttesenSCG-928-I21]
MITRTLARVNEVSIQVVENGSEKLVPIKPICEALGIEFEPQRRKLNEDDFLNSVTTLKVATGNDGKQYEMICLPYQYIFGWLFTINPKKTPLTRLFLFLNFSYIFVAKCLM